MLNLPPARRRLDRALAWAGLLVLLVLHVDFWRPQRPVLWLGWLPEELAYRLGWMLLAWLYLLFFTRWIWRSGEGSGEPSGGDGEDGR